MGYLHLVFGAECTMRAFQSKRFGPRRPRTTRICLGIFAFLILITWIPTAVVKSPKKCFGDIAWRTLMYSTLALTLISVLIFTFMIMAIIIGMRLIRTVNIEPNERIAASRVFYYLLASVVIHVSYETTELRHLADSIRSSSFLSTCKPSSVCSRLVLPQP